MMLTETRDPESYVSNITVGINSLIQILLPAEFSSSLKKGSCPLQMVLIVLLSSVRYYLDLSASLWTWGHQVSNLPLCISALLKFVLCLSVAVSLLLFVSILTMIVLHWNGSSRALSVNSSSPVCKTCQAPHFSE